MSGSRRPTGFPAAVDKAIESLCTLGCQHVLETIDRLDRGEVPAPLMHLAPGARALVLGELKSIMAVYGHSCRTASPPTVVTRQAIAT